jgi:hypothetical protein
MVEYMGLIITVVIVLGLGGGGGYLLWLMTRPPKMTWTAYCYQKGDGIKPQPKDDKGNFIPSLSDIKLSDLKPFCKDVLERIEKAKGMTIYRLQMLNKVTPAVTQDVVHYWGPKEKIVHVLIDGDTCTLLKNGYSNSAGVIFTPMPHDRSNMIREEMAIVEERLKKPKDILEAIMPMITIAICMVGLVALAYITGNSNIEVSKNIENGQIQAGDSLVEAAKIYSQALGVPIVPDNKLKKEEPPTMNP